jgi:acetyl-CoA carboxylase biotin carboxyl carrier protein
VGLSDEDVREILRIIAESPLQELRLETEGFSLYVRRGLGAGAEPEEAQASVPKPVPEAAPADQPHQADVSRDGAVAIEAPMLGTFYRAPGPGQEPFVQLGTPVDHDSTVCIIEVMKMMNSVPAGVSGTVVEVAAENGQLVEYGQPLFYVRPA